MRVEDINMVKICGGASSISSTFLNYLSNLLKTVYSIGQEFGGSLRRIATKNVCPL